jgi:hypothetical protein
MGAAENAGAAGAAGANFSGPVLSLHSGLGSGDYIGGTAKKMDIEFA